MEQLSYKSAMSTIWRGVRLFLRCWGITIHRLGKDILHGIFRHWFFALVIVAAYVAMFVTMGNARAERDNVSMTNYQLSQELDSLKILAR